MVGAGMGRTYVRHGDGYRQLGRKDGVAWRVLLLAASVASAIAVSTMVVG